MMTCAAYNHTRDDSVRHLITRVMTRCGIQQCAYDSRAESAHGRLVCSSGKSREFTVQDLNDMYKMDDASACEILAPYQVQE
jgi:hypothetical protein